VHSYQEITCAAQQVGRLHGKRRLPLTQSSRFLRQWAAALDGRELREVPGLAFSPALAPPGHLRADSSARAGPDFTAWRLAGRWTCKAAGISAGVVGHWPAGEC